MEAEHNTAIDKLSEQLNKIFNHFQHIKELLRWENFLRSIGLPDDMGSQTIQQGDGCRLWRTPLKRA
ncbi:MAG: hypothetical protein RSA50_07670 [Mucinivorans sp.]